MSIETTIVTFRINGSFSEWCQIFDSEEATKRHAEFCINPIYRGVSLDDPKKVVVIHQAESGNVEKFIEANGDWIATHNVDLSSFNKTTWSNK